MVEERWSPPCARTRKDLDVGSLPYFRRLTRTSRHISFDASTAVAAADHQHSPFHSCSSAVPFSWERRPGIPKTSGYLASRSTALRLPLRLPLPPPLRPASAAPQKKRPAAAEDPFAVALAECAKCPPGPSIEELFSRTGSAAVPRSRGASSMSISDRLSLFGLHAVSCKAACTVVDSTVYIPRPRLREGNSDSSSYGLPHRRFVRSLSGTKRSFV